MNSLRTQGGWLIALSVLLALVLTLVPLPSSLEHLRPNWVALVLIYWSLALPSRVGVGIAWLVGILQDALQGTLLGAHALVLALSVFLIIELHQRIRNFPIWQQALTVLFVLSIGRAALLWIRGLGGNADLDWRFWMPALTSAVIWPLIFGLLRTLRRYYRVS
jgi:rod shape-determining protein MreD